MSEHDEPKTALTRLLGEHRPNVVTEQVGNPDNPGVGDLVWRTRMKCDGEDCTFYAEGPRYWEVVKEHDEHLADVLLAEGYTTSPAPEATETVEFGLIDHGGGVVINVPPWTHPRDVEQYARELGYRNVRKARRTRTSYADRVTEWVPVDRAADEHEEGGQ